MRGFLGDLGTLAWAPGHKRNQIATHTHTNTKHMSHEMYFSLRSNFVPLSLLLLIGTRALPNIDCMCRLCVFTQVLQCRSCASGAM